jgi:acetyl esterase
MPGPTPATDLRKAIETVDRNRLLLERASSLVYRETPSRPLLAHLFRPPGFTPREARPAMLFFHGSVWDRGLVSQFAPHAYYFAQRGMHTALFEYRINSTDGTGAPEALEDIAEAHRWLFGRAGVFGIDPRKVVSCGASGGAWAAMVWTLQLLALKPLERPADPPAALVLYEPICETGPKCPGFQHFPDRATARKLNPLGLLAKNPPPAIVMHGTGDTVVPFATSTKFARRWQRKKGRCDIIPYKGAQHGFHNFNFNIRLYENSINAVDGFLASLGLIEPAEPLVAF